MLHILIFASFFRLLYGATSVDNLFLAIGYILFIIGLQFLFHSIPNIIIYKKMKDFNDIKSFIKVEVVTFGLIMLSYLLLVVHYF